MYIFSNNPNKNIFLKVYSILFRDVIGMYIFYYNNNLTKVIF